MGGFTSKSPEPAGGSSAANLMLSPGAIAWQVDTVDGTTLGVNASSFGFVNASAAIPHAELTCSSRYRAVLLLCCSGYGISEGSLAQLRGPQIHNVDEWLRRVAGLSRVSVSSCGLVASTVAIVQQLLPVPHDAFHTIQLSPIDQTQNWNMWCVAIALRFARPLSGDQLPAAPAMQHIVITGLANKVPYRSIQAACALAQWVCDGISGLPFNACLRPEYQQHLHSLMATSKNLANWDKTTACVQHALASSGQLAQQLSQRHASSATFIAGMLALRAHALLKPPSDEQLWFQDEKGLVDNVMVVCCTAALMATSVTAAAEPSSTCWLALQRWAQLCGAARGTIAAAVGAVWGCHFGLRTVPAPQFDALQGRARLLSAADSLFTSAGTFGPCDAWLMPQTVLQAQKLEQEAAAALASEGADLKGLLEGIAKRSVELDSLTGLDDVERAEKKRLLSAFDSLESQLKAAKQARL